MQYIGMAEIALAMIALIGAIVTGKMIALIFAALFAIKGVIIIIAHRYRSEDANSVK
jgi:hypothetical protein